MLFPIPTIRKKQKKCSMCIAPDHKKKHGTYYLLHTQYVIHTRYVRTALRYYHNTLQAVILYAGG